MVHLAIDGMWQVFKLQRSTLRNDFCRIAAKNGILLRLINTLYSLNEATRLALISGGGGFSMITGFNSMDRVRIDLHKMQNLDNKHESILPLLHSSNEKKTNGMDFLMAEFAGKHYASSRGRENANTEATNRTTHNKLVNKKVVSKEGEASTSGIASQTASGVLSGSGVLNARPGSATSSGLLSHMVSPWNADVAREYLEKVADLLLEFAGADSTVKSYMCIQSLLSRLFQMFNKIEPPILLIVQIF
ncbi:hypothetical protein Tco_1554131 [Tanacetum coccineum]